MASIYDKASLVMIPSGSKEGKLYSQKPTNGDGRRSLLTEMGILPFLVQLLLRELMQVGI
jgi:hypothetical protein